MGKMKSREGKAVDADDLVEALTALARAAVAQRFPDLPDEEAAPRARKIALAALKFMILRVSPEAGMVYDPEESLAFTGATGPYLLYSYARVASIKRKTAVDESVPPAFERLGDPNEVRLARLILRQPDVIRDAAEGFNPALLANHLFETAQAFSGFFENCHIKNCPDPGLQRARMMLAEATATALRGGLALLGIDVVEQM